jgi:hypothetical protein
MDRGRSQQIGDWLQFIAQPDTAALILRGHAGDPALTAVEFHRYLWSMYPLFLHFEDSYYQHQGGMIGDGQYASILGHLKSQSSTPGFHALWWHIRDTFPPVSPAFVDDVMRDVQVSGAEIADWTAAWKSCATGENPKAGTSDASALGQSPPAASRNRNGTSGNTSFDTSGPAPDLIRGRTARRDDI